MKEEMILKYDNNIEVINGIEVNWNKYKGVGKGKILERGKSSYIDICEILHKNNNKLLSDYISAREKILIDFNCGHTPHWIKPSVYKQGSGCPVCAKERSITSGIKGGIDSYSNREEVICNFKVDWSKFKIKSDLNEDNLRVVKKNYLKFLKELNDRGDELIDDFINNKTITTVRLKCGHTKRITPNNYNKGCKCGMCDGITAKRKKQAKNDLLVLLNKNNHKLLSDYMNSLTKVLIDFNCGHEPHWISPNYYRDFDKCPVCLKEEKYERKVKPLIDLINKNNHKLLSDYENDNKSILIDFNCGHEPHWIKPVTYKNNTTCPKCIAFNSKKNKILNIANNNNHKIISNYGDDNTKILIDFNCGHEPHWMDYNSYNIGAMCPDCKRERVDEIKLSRINEFYALVDKNNHNILSDYISVSQKVLIDFNCGHEPHWITPNHYKNGKGCPLCKNKGEAALYKLLVDMGYEVTKQKKYDDLKDKGLLPYDFYLPKYNLLIELDGMHHYKPVTYYSNEMTEKERDVEKLDAEIRFHDRQRKDKIKDKYAEDNNIALLRIDYRDGKTKLDKWKHLILSKINYIQTKEEFMIT